MSSETFTAVKRSSIWLSVAKQIRDQIENGVLAEGDRLPSERDLCQRFGISRISLREALRALEREGYLEVQAGRGAYIRSTRQRDQQVLENWVEANDDNVEKVLELRMLFEPNVAALVARKATPDALRRLQATVDELTNELGDPARAIEADASFHRVLGESTDNPLVESLVHFVMNATGAERRLTLMTREGVKQALKGHARILERIAAHDSDGAFSAMRKHLEDAVKYAAKNGKKAPSRRRGG